MKRSGSQYTDLAAWWHAWQGTASAEEVAVLRDVIAPLLAQPLDPQVAPGIVSQAHLAQVLGTLDELGADAETLATGCQYHRARHGGVAGGGSDNPLVARLLEADSLEVAWQPGHDEDAEGLRRLLLALVRDVRVLLIVVADRLATLRAIAGADDEVRRRIAQRVAAIHAPLANRLGIWQLKWELEDLIFRYQQPDLYHRIARLLDERRADRERYITTFVADLKARLAEAGVQAEVRGRPKHIYSIWRKMHRKNLVFDQVFDVRAVRVLVDSVADCYTTLGVAHAQWHPIPGEFDDYIANPKPNGYRSLHTAVFGPGGKPVEIQIRTTSMHEEAELGVAAHWRYKEGGAHDPAFQRKLNAMRQLLEGRGDDDDFLADFGADDDEERVYAMTPRGQVIDLRAGATVLDFAYHVHTDIGHRCRGAKVNGRIVPLTRVLANGEQVEILTGKEPDPSRDWMVPSLGYLATPRARAKVRQWFKKADHDRNVADGRDVLDKDLKRLGVSHSDLRSIVGRFNKHDLEGLYEAVGVGEITPGQVANALQKDTDDTGDSLPVAPPARRQDGGEILIEGVGNLLTTMARCCSPVPGDPIIGFVTRGRGVSVHRRDCANAARLISEQPGRLLEVEWAQRSGSRYRADVGISAWDRPGLIRDIGNLLVACHSDVLSMSSDVDPTSGQAQIRLSLRVADFEHLSQLLNRLTSLPSVFEAHRVG